MTLTVISGSTASQARSVVPWFGAVSGRQGASITGADTAGGTDVATKPAGFPRTSADTAGGTDAAVRSATNWSRTTADNAHIGASLVLDEFGHPIFDETGAPV